MVWINPLGFGDGMGLDGLILQGRGNEIELIGTVRFWTILKGTGLFSKGVGKVSG